MNAFISCNGIARMFLVRAYLIPPTKVLSFSD